MLDYWSPVPSQLQGIAGNVALPWKCSPWDAPFARLATSTWPRMAELEADMLAFQNRPTIIPTRIKRQARIIIHDPKTSPTPACLNGRASILVPTRWALPLLPKSNNRNFLFAASTPTSAVHNALVVVDPPTAIAVPDLTLAIDSFKAYSALVATLVNLLLYLLAERGAGSWFLPSFNFERAHCVQRNGRHFCPAGSFSLAWFRSRKQARRAEVEDHFVRG